MDATLVAPSVWQLLLGWLTQPTHTARGIVIDKSVMGEMGERDTRYLRIEIVHEHELRAEFVRVDHLAFGQKIYELARSGDPVTVAYRMKLFEPTKIGSIWRI